MSTWTSLNLIPADLSKLTDSHVDAIESHYGKFLTFTEKVSLQPEVREWKKDYEVVQKGHKPTSVNSALSDCSPVAYLTLHKESS